MKSKVVFDNNKIINLSSSKMRNLSKGKNYQCKELEKYIHHRINGHEKNKRGLYLKIL